MSTRPFSQQLLDRTNTTILRYNLLAENEKVIVAVSGGADSMALLQLLHTIEMPLRLVAAYIDHGLRPLESKTEMNTMRKRCADLHIRFIMQSVNVTQYSASNKCSTEEAARVLRYRALETLRRDNGATVIATGHTADDQVEEFFIRLVRGTGVKGLSGMLMKTGSIIRPLLHEKKNTLCQYLQEAGINWCEDSSNWNRRFLRNRVRHDLLPMLEKEFNPGLRSTVLQTMDILRVEEDYLSQACHQHYDEIVSLSDTVDTQGELPELRLEVAQIVKLHEALQRRVLEKCCWKLMVKPSFQQIQAISHLLREGMEGKILHLSDGVRVQRCRQILLFSRPLEPGRRRGSPPSPPSTDLRLSEIGTFELPDIRKKITIAESHWDKDIQAAGNTLTLDRDLIRFPLHLRSHLPGDRFRAYNRPGSKKVARFLSDLKIPAKERPLWPVLLSEGHIIAMPGLEIAHDYQVTANTKKILTIVWQDLD